MFAGPLEARPWEVARNSTCSSSPEHFEPVPSCFVLPDMVHPFR